MDGFRDQIRPYAGRDPVMLTVQEAAALLACSDDTVYAMIREGRIPAMRLRNTYRIDRYLMFRALEAEK